jgi:gluconate 2-dehydrogenase gamma chain
MFDQAGMDRRALIARALLLVGASAIPVNVAAFAATPMRSKKRFLNPVQFALMSAIADTIVPTTDTPGAGAVGVPKQIDSMLLNWASPARRTEISGAIDAVDKFSLEQAQKNFVALNEAKRKEVLLTFDKNAVKANPNPKTKPTGLAAMMGGGVTPMNPGYVKLKELVINLYYASEMASTKELPYEHVPGAFVASFPVTPETRPFAGVGGLF